MAAKENLGAERKRKIAVTGNQGYIGSVLTRLLIEAGYKVVGIDAGIFEDVQMVPRLPATVQIKKDIRDIEKDDLAGCEAVIHLAGLSNDPLGELDQQLTYDINFKAGVRLAEIAKKAKIERFLFSSSCSTYGASGPKVVTEKDKVNPRTAYAKSKVMMEKELVRMASHGFVPVILRNATVFGFSPRLRLDLVVNDLTANGYLNGRIEVLSDGTPWRPNLHVMDCAKAFMFLMEAPAEQVCREAFNIGQAANNRQVRDIAAKVQQVIAGSKIIIKSESTRDERTYRVSFDKIEQAGWQAKWSINQGVQDLVQIFRKRGFDNEDSKFNGYYTLRRYRAMMQAGLMSNTLRMIDDIKVKV
ncbi:MAG: hypothetical protein A3E37_03235 [Candidatus Andersenbacteria bacterium RIFCSPHIGHO2_12_FULL_46_9]|nr:MAG: NAD-dependent epimerase/dehydratase [Parcubacteria group bacterium GW2011_GWA2_45_14]OGY33803.1 MAG: hypothetical protein A3B76_02990 [Candidatus Andersenbacteria bacterium RIFCSPHIGHO2_02_FULL_46_16]OGY36238.1 MAG: hypothetical protein A3I08_05310 [Candidatus Andersenbacteria bacterium RIFCSPLOWO2_02_FULL_46_11]OGY36677.1 MAG: hypothetical protein A3E37_03235 [Candidatus Andersenbacteria bacterium RIFCSPHIGHO2_12_FULL_46_9]OGY42738.1 MAG: hypothetical protein A3G57_03225 [Candidatus An